MNYSHIITAAAMTVALSACDRPAAVVTPAVVTPSVVAVPGPAGAPGATGDAGAKGEPGKSSTETVVIVPAAPAEPASK
jgi:hypothetical protein